MKYYVYVSLTKIEMLYSQIEQDAQEKESSLGFDIKILKGEIKEKTRPTTNTFSKLDSVINKLNKLSLIGGLESEKQYLHATLPMRFGGYGFHAPDSPIAFWGSSTFDYPFEGTAVALAGSSHHLIGDRAEGSGSAHSHSITEAMVAWFLKNLDDNFPDSDRKKLEKYGRGAGRFKMDNYDVANAAYLAATQMTGQTSNYEFLAKVLHRSKWPDGFRMSKTREIVLGSPLYVCLAE